MNDQSIKNVKSIENEKGITIKGDLKLFGKNVASGATIEGVEKIAGKGRWGISEKMIKIDDKCFMPKTLYKYEKISTQKISIPVQGKADCKVLDTTGYANCTVMPGSMHIDMSASSDKDFYYTSVETHDSEYKRSTLPLPGGQPGEEQNVLAQVPCR